MPSHGMTDLKLPSVGFLGCLHTYMVVMWYIRYGRSAKSLAKKKKKKN